MVTAVILFRAFKIQEFTNEFNTRLTALERRLEGKDSSVRLSVSLSLSVETLKAVEIESCKKDVAKLKEQL